MIHCYSLFSFKTPLLVSFSVEVKREKTLTGCFSINRFFFSFIATAWLLKTDEWKVHFWCCLQDNLEKRPLKLAHATVMNWLPLFLYTTFKKESSYDNIKWSCLVFFFWEQSRKLMTSFNYVKDDPRNNNLLVSHARIKYSFFKGLLSTYLLDRKLI